jgi:hypothetical protein
MKIALFAVLVATTASALAQDGMACDAHHASVNKRGDSVMGFDHAKTTHRFHLTAVGGVISVSASDAADASNRDAIRTHLSHIAKMFAAGNFDAPILIHDRIPPGAPVMKARRRAIRYTYRETPAGADIVISTSNAKALTAIHDFLRFQIEDHQTGDSLEVETGTRGSTPGG